jgi:hypothetical protein
MSGSKEDGRWGMRVRMKITGIVIPFTLQLNKKVLGWKRKMVAPVSQLDAIATLKCHPAITKE